MREVSTEYRTLGKSGLKVSEIGLGGNKFGERISEHESVSVIRHALELGVNFIDTANVYSQGRSEKFVGKAVEGRRSEVIIATKFGVLMGNHPNEWGASRYYITKGGGCELKASQYRLH